MEASTNAMTHVRFQMQRMEKPIWEHHLHRFALHAQILLTGAANNAFHHVLTETQLPLIQLQLWSARLLPPQLVHTSREMDLYIFAWLPAIPQISSTWMIFA